MEGIVARRVIPSDNSCLFNADRNVMDHDKNKAPELRQMSPFDGAPEEFDQTIFPVQSNRTIGPAEELALNLVKEQHRKRSFTGMLDRSGRTEGGCGTCSSD